MGFNTSATSVTLIARLTPFGRERLLSGDINVIRKFSIGDSDANYRTSEPLITGEVPNIGGLIGGDYSFTNSSTNGLKIKFPVSYNIGQTFKPIEQSSFSVDSEVVKLGRVTLTGSGITQNVLVRTNTTESLTNLFASFGLPITDTDKAYFDGLTNANGGYSDTSLSGFNEDNVLLIGIDQNYFGEQIDGKSIKITLDNGVLSYDIYSTYQKSNLTTDNQDAKYRESSTTNLRKIGDPIVALFCDDIQRPNNDPAKSWATGYGEAKPFSVGNKIQFNYIAAPSLSQIVDKSVGACYLDKGFIVITDPTLVSTFSGEAITVSYNSIATEVFQSISCIKERNEFTKSVNPTYINTDIIRMSELGLYDGNDNLIAIAKPDRHIELPSIGFSVLSVKLMV